MADPRAVLDASALVAFLFKERGHEVIKKLIDAGVATTPTGLAEALDIARRKGHKRTRDELADDLAELGLAVEPLVAEDGTTIAYLLALADAKAAENPKVGTLSLGDAACLAVADRLEIPAVFSDGTWEALDLRIKILPFR